MKRKKTDAFLDGESVFSDWSTVFLINPKMIRMFIGQNKKKFNGSPASNKNGGINNAVQRSNSSEN